jgi:hypothetical protein
MRRAALIGVLAAGWARADVAPPEDPARFLTVEEWKLTIQVAVAGSTAGQAAGPFKCGGDVGDSASGTAQLRSSFFAAGFSRSWEGDFQVAEAKISEKWECTGPATQGMTSAGAGKPKRPTPTSRTPPTPASTTWSSRGSAAFTPTAAST